MRYEYLEPLLEKHGVAIHGKLVKGSIDDMAAWNKAALLGSCINDLTKNYGNCNIYYNNNSEKGIAHIMIQRFNAKPIEAIGSTILEALDTLYKMIGEWK